MRIRLPQGSVRRIAVVSVLIVAVIGTAMGVTIWRYEIALNRSDVSYAQLQESDATAALSSIFWQEYSVMLRYLLTGAPADLDQVTGLHSQFVASIPATAGTVPGQPRLTSGVASAQLSLYATFRAVQPVAGTSLPRILAAQDRLAAKTASMVAALNSLRRAAILSSATEQDDASSVASQALVIGLAVAVLAVMSGLGFALYAVRLVVLGRRREEELRALDKMKDEFVSLVSHELRTPLASIIGYLELLGDEEAEPLTSRQHEFATVMTRNAARLLRLVDDLLFLSQLQSGTLATEFSEADLPEIARLAVEAAHPAADSKDITISLSAQPVPALRADRIRLAQLLDNLLSNAIKFTPRGGQVAVTVDTEDGSAALDVSDNGVGISAAEQEHVFERFFRTRNAAARAISGTGLGLTIVKAIVDAHGGTITLTSEVGRGTTFRVRLPVGEAGRAAGSTGDPG